MTGITCLYTGIAIVGLAIFFFNASAFIVTFWGKDDIRFSDGLPFYVVFLICVVMTFSGAYMAYKCYDKDFEIMIKNNTIEYNRNNRIERKLN